MEQLIEDYKRRLFTIQQMIEEDDQKNVIKTTRLQTKASCYRTFITELESTVESN